jgi:hypothetical protein
MASPEELAPEVENSSGVGLHPSPQGNEPVTKQFMPSQDSHDQSKNDPCRPLVVLVHGIRTGGKWIRRLKRILESEAACVVEPAGYGFFDVFRFLLPGPTRKVAVETVKWKLLHAIDRHKQRPLIVVAHSFGTFCITEILKDSPQIRPARLLFCGSIVAQEFRWDSLSQMAPERGMHVVNECGARDVWPPLAHSVTFGYGSSGTGGFQVQGVEDRYHDLGHGGYFTREFVQQFWVPFIKDGTITPSKYEEEMPEAPWWISILGLRPIFPWLMWFVLALVGCAVVFGTGLLTPLIRPPAQSPEIASMVAAVAQDAQQAEKYAEDRYQVISSALQNQQTTVAQQIAALRELPEAMSARVPVAVIDKNAPSGSADGGPNEEPSGSERIRRYCTCVRFSPKARGVTCATPFGREAQQLPQQRPKHCRHDHGDQNRTADN